MAAKLQSFLENPFVFHPTLWGGDIRNNPRWSWLESPDGKEKTTLPAKAAVWSQVIRPRNDDVERFLGAIATLPDADQRMVLDELRHRAQWKRGTNGRLSISSNVMITLNEYLSEKKATGVDLGAEFIAQAGYFGSIFD
jgi:hypothetical protein